MRVVPAIDLYKKRVVRLEKGEKASCHIYDFEPVELLELFVSEGFTLVHLIDLSRAIDNSNENDTILQQIADRGLARFVQIGGGLRSLDVAKKLAELGFKRQIFSTLLMEDTKNILKLIQIGIDVVMSLDTSSRGVRTKGWIESVRIDFEKLLKDLESLGLKELVHTDVDRDGMLGGRSLELTKQLASITGLKIYVAGGISSVEDLERVKKLCEEISTIEGVIVGRAFYERKISLKEMKNYAR